MTISEFKNNASKKSKYGNKKTEYNGILFDSKHEANVAMQLDTLRKATKSSERVVDIQYQVPFILQENFTDKVGRKHQAIKYMADFVVTYGDKRIEIIDAKSKGTMTNVYKIKKKMLLFKYGIEIKEIF